jgi:hypothetical protein
VQPSSFLIVFFHFIPRVLPDCLRGGGGGESEKKGGSNFKFA